MKVRKAALPEDSMVAKYLPIDFTEVLAVDVTEGRLLNADDIQAKFWTDMPAWITFLFKLRNVLVKPFGLRGGGSDTDQFAEAIHGGTDYGIMSVTDKTDKETVLCLNDKHLQAYLSVYVESSAQATRQRVVVTTLVKFHKWFGKLYFYSIYPFHGLIVKAQLKRILRKLME